ncbi:MAG TPA: RNA polymerase sigma factor SigZ [Nitrospiria bacterium]
MELPKTFGSQTHSGKKMDVSAVWMKFHKDLHRFLSKQVRNKQDADDILQDIFIKIHKHSNQLKVEESLKAWVFKIVKNAMVDHYRREGKQATPQVVFDNFSDQAHQITFNEEAGQCLKPMLENLPERYRSALFLTEFQGITQKELTQHLGRSLSGAKSRVQRGREKLKTLLLACCHFELDRLGNILEYEKRGKDCQYCKKC